MKLCEMVFAFHQRPIATSGIEGDARSRPAWTIARVTNSPSRPTLVDRVACQSRRVAIIAVLLEATAASGSAHSCCCYSELSAARTIPDKHQAVPASLLPAERAGAAGCDPQSR